ncbi:histone-lysine N-methyltransferase SMYD3-like isoform X2 [Malaya genurostris]|nr:histone-lysine N-methyltransferase SMYD3-like isoform X2 [Malaya genurostris]XP_058461264.1 histone-lysine N-methyltransferase SMYD3-like isoform X2 [Malaya genurostris]
MIRPEVVQQLESPAFGLATSWILSRNCVPADSLDEVQRFFQREFWPFPKTHPRKDEILANALRVKANGTYMNKSVEQEVVLRLYNESICHAPDKAEELGIGYANRSAVYFNQKQYNHCLDNILLAKANNYPTSKMQKLLEREQKCLNMMQECSNERKQPVVTDNEQHNSNLEMASIPDYGRGFIATKDLKVGNLALIEKFSLLVLEHESAYSRCNHCGFGNNLDLIPCRTCCSAMYCSEQCRANAYNQYHRFECGITEDLKCLFKGPKPTRVFHIALRLFWIAMGDLLKNAEAFCLEYKQNLNDYRNPLNVDPSKLHFHILSESTSRKNKDKTDKGITQFFTVLAYHIAVKENTAFPTGQILNEYESVLLEVLYRLFWIAISICDQSIKGMTCLYPLLRLVNHTCAPNVERCWINQQSVLVVKRPIKAGEQILLCYISNNTFESMTKDKRVSLLQKHFNFICQCLACVLDYPQLNTVQDNQILRSELQTIDSVVNDEQKRRALEKYLERHDDHYPLKELSEAWQIYRKLRADLKASCD